jgi:hypothetical protein
MHPASFSSDSIPSEDANGSNVNPDNSIPELWMHRPTFLMDDAPQQRENSNLPPYIPIGSLISD